MTDITKSRAPKSRGINRRKALAGLGTLGLAAATGGVSRFSFAQATGPAIGKGQTVIISLWGGITEDSIRKFVQPVFEKMTGAKLDYDIGGQGARVNKLLAQRDNPPCDVIFTTDEAVLMGHSVGVLIPARRKNIPNLADVFPWAHTVPDIGGADGIAGVPYTLISGVLAYNPEKFKTPPTSWADMWRPEVRGKMSFTSPAGSTMPEQVIIAAELAGGSVSNPDPGFKKLAELRPIKLTTFWTDWAPLLKTGDVIMAPELDYYVEAMKTQGYPVDYIFPKEKATGLPEYASIVKGTNNPELAEAFLNILIDPKTQEGLSIETYQGTINSKVKLSNEAAKRCACGERTAQLRFYDPKMITAVRAPWTERLNTEVIPNWGKI